MFGFLRAGGYAAAAALLSATVVAADSTQATGVSAPVEAADFASHAIADSQPLILAAEQESLQVALPVQRELPANDHSDITVDGLADPTPVVVPEATAENAEPTPRRSLSDLVATHRSSEVPSRERECLAGAIYFESKGEPLSGQVAVGQVILNRAKSGRFPKSWCGVVFQRSQFSFVRGGALPPIPRGSAQWKTAVAVAHIVANDLTDVVVPRALFFHARYVSPNWKRLSRVASVGNHVFYR